MDTISQWVMWLFTLLGDKLLRKLFTRSNIINSSSQSSPVLHISHLQDNEYLLDDKILHDANMPSKDGFFFEYTSSHDHNSFSNSHVLDDKDSHGHIIPFDLNDNLSLHDETQQDNNNLFLLPDEIIAEILSRLDIECTHRCRHVCTRFHKMMSTPYFISMHLNQNRGKPIIVVCFSEHVRMHYQNPDVFKIPLLFIDEGNNQIWRTKVKFKLDYKQIFYPILPDLIGSYNGLLLFRHENNDVFLIIVNPITQEHVHVTFPSADYELCGFYFHTPTREYKILYMLQQLNKPCRYFVYSLKNKLIREISSHTEAPCTCRSPIILNGVLHWMTDVGDERLSINPKPVDCSKSILLFKMDNEEFITMPHPGSQCQSKERHKTRMYLLEMKGQLCFCNITSPPEEGYDAEVYIWVLKDFTKQIWVRKYIVSLFLMSMFPNEFHWDPLVELLQIRNNTLLLKRGPCKLFCYHLVLDTFREVDLGSSVIMKSVVIHTNSLVSLQTNI